MPGSAVMTPLPRHHVPERRQLDLYAAAAVRSSLLPRYLDNLGSRRVAQDCSRRRHADEATGRAAPCLDPRVRRPARHLRDAGKGGGGGRSLARHGGVSAQVPPTRRQRRGGPTRRGLGEDIRTCLVKFDPGPGADSLIVCRKDLSPEGHEFGTLGDPTINVAGDAAYTAKLTAGRNGVFRGGTSIVALTGDPSPAGPGFFKKFSSTALITDAGDVVFEAFISGGAVVGGVSIDRGYFRCGGGDGNCSTGGTGTIETLVLKNDLVPDRP